MANRECAALLVLPRRQRAAAKPAARPHAQNARLMPDIEAAVNPR